MDGKFHRPRTGRDPSERTGVGLRDGDGPVTRKPEGVVGTGGRIYGGGSGRRDKTTNETRRDDQILEKTRRNTRDSNVVDDGLLHESLMNPLTLVELKTVKTVHSYIIIKVKSLLLLVES